VVHVPNGTYDRPGVHDSMLLSEIATEVFAVPDVSLSAGPDLSAKVVGVLLPLVAPKRLPASRAFPLSIARPSYQSNTVPAAWPAPKQVRRADTRNSS